MNNAASVSFQLSRLISFTLSIPQVQPNSISTKILPGLSLASTKTKTKGYMPTTTITIRKCYRGKPTITVQCTVGYQTTHQCRGENPDPDSSTSITAHH